MLTRDRDAFILLSQGILMDRDSQGRVVIGDTKEAHAAMAAHARGEWVRLKGQDDTYTYIKDGTEMVATDYKRHRKAGMK